MQTSLAVSGADLTALQCELSYKLKDQGYLLVVTESPKQREGMFSTIMGCPVLLKCPFRLELVRKRKKDDVRGEWWELGRVCDEHNHQPLPRAETVVPSQELEFAEWFTTTVLTKASPTPPPVRNLTVKAVKVASTATQQPTFTTLKHTAINNPPSSPLSSILCDSPITPTTSLLPAVGTTFRSSRAFERAVGRTFHASGGRLVLPIGEKGGPDMVVFKCCYKEPECRTRVAAVKHVTADGGEEWRVVRAEWGHSLERPPIRRRGPSEGQATGSERQSRSGANTNGYASSADDGSSPESVDAHPAVWLPLSSSPMTMELDLKSTPAKGGVVGYDADCTLVVPSIEFSVAPTPNSHRIDQTAGTSSHPTPSWTPFPAGQLSSTATTPSGLPLPTSPGLLASLPLAPNSSETGMEVDRPLAIAELFNSFQSMASSTFDPTSSLLPTGLSCSGLAPAFGSPPLPTQPTFASAWDPTGQLFQSSPFPSPFTSPFASHVPSRSTSPFPPSLPHLTTSHAGSASSFSLSPALPFADLHLARSNSLASASTASSAASLPLPSLTGHDHASAQAAWFAFLFALDPELTAHAEVLALPEWGVTPASFFRQRKELRAVFLGKLGGKMGEWPRMCLQDAIEREGERVWAEVQQLGQGQGGMRARGGWASSDGGADGEGLVLTFQ